MHVYQHKCKWQRRSDDSVRSPETTIMDGYKVLWKCWEGRNRDLLDDKLLALISDISPAKIPFLKAHKSYQFPGHITENDSA